MSSDAAKPRLLTESDLYQLPDDERRQELVAGFLVSEPPPGFRHGGVAAQIVGALVLYLRDKKLGRVLSGDTGFVLHRGPDTVRVPDIAFVSQSRLAAVGYTTRCFPGAPDLAVEVLSPGDRPAELRSKVADYLTAGTKLVWLVDPEACTVTVYESLLAPRILTASDQLDGGELLPGFRVAVAALFE